MKCSIVGCENITMNDTKVDCCAEHEDEVIQYFEEEYIKHQAELYRDWRSSQ